MIAALYVETDGVYFGQAGVDPWDLARDARSYAGPHPVVAHPYEYLMGMPTGWTELVPLATARFRLWLHSHGATLANTGYRD